MCLLVFSYDQHSDYPLIFAGNRDEFYERPAASADRWEDAPHVLGGRDLEAGGTWMGVTRAGHWGVVTNIRDPHSYRADARSRGALVAEYLRETPDPHSYLDRVATEAEQYNGFNLLVGTPTSLYYLSNRNARVQAVEPGIHGLSNDHLNTPWPKVKRAKRGLQARLQKNEITVDSLLALLEDRRPAPEEQLPETGLGRERERMLSPIFIEGERYGTRASTVLLMERDGTVTFAERTFEAGRPVETRRFSFTVRRQSTV
ncbi:hypothetical protein BSZ35_15740 [Salinibacter sp. 10B]|uniref:NRDE family protein n=1 Tax=Salinibacter sp. 10B TaxID=1923971 RepID=UPI000CF4915C|nr:NRDE family protein [Salinibacter sp. 10B]PQJ35856.1 hypothetical protein BSZ35_15740 [Salinibacter sp. 10B]